MLRLVIPFAFRMARAAAPSDAVPCPRAGSTLFLVRGAIRLRALNCVPFPPPLEPIWTDSSGTTRKRSLTRTLWADAQGHHLVMAGVAREMDQKEPPQRAIGVSCRVAGQFRISRRRRDASAPEPGAIRFPLPVEPAGGGAAGIS